MSNGQITRTVRGRLVLLSVLFSSVGLTGCASSYRMAEVNEVYQIPDDCRNRSMLDNWLQNQLDNGKPVTQKGEDFNAQVSAVKTKMWRLRAICQSR